MRIIVFLSLLILTFSPVLADEFGTKMSNCTTTSNSFGDYNDRIEDCDWLLDSGKLTKGITPYIFGYRGNMYNLMDQYDRAIQDFDQAIRLKPDYYHAFTARGNSYFMMHQYDRAIQDYNQAIRLKSDYSISYHFRGLAYKKKGQFSRAIRDFRMALEINPSFPKASDAKRALEEAEAELARQ